eukprot:gene35587-47859_t
MGKPFFLFQTFNRVYSPSLFPIGTFSLDQTWQPLFRVLVGKLKWAAILAEKNRVSLTVSDSTLASEFGLLEKWGGTLDAAASDDVTRFHDSVDLEGGGGTQRPEDRRMLKFTPVGGSVEVKLMCQFDSSFSPVVDGSEGTA